MRVKVQSVSGLIYTSHGFVIWSGQTQEEFDYRTPGMERATPLATSSLVAAGEEGIGGESLQSPALPQCRRNNSCALYTEHGLVLLSLQSGWPQASPKHLLGVLAMFQSRNHGYPWINSSPALLSLSPSSPLPEPDPQGSPGNRVETNRCAQKEMLGRN